MPNQTRHFLFYCSYYSVAFIAFTLLLIYLGRLDLLTDFKFITWDAAWYERIADHGYKGESTAFFPCTSIVWRVLSLSAGQMSVLNAFCFITGLSWLSAEFKWNLRTRLISATIPSVIFMFVPFSEALFFLFVSAFLIGIHKDIQWLRIAGLVLCCFTRPAFAVLIMAVPIAEALCSQTSKEYLRRAGFHLLAVLTGTFLAFGVHWFETGQWFSFFSEQRKWGNGLRLPALPVWTWGDVILLDQIALFLGLSAVIPLAAILWSRLIRKKMAPRLLTYCLLYLAGISIFCLFFRGGDLFSLNRFFFATPFFIVGLWQVSQHFSITWKTVLLIVLLYIAHTIILSTAYEHIRKLLQYNILLLLIIPMAFALSIYPRVRKGGAIITVLILFSCQLVLMLKLMSYHWVA